GHVKGAVTGAVERRVGRFELADGGTIFLDEVGELPLETQVKLLRVLQEQEFEPVGSNRTVRVNVRVIAATNRDLQEAVRTGRFRPDLFYRLNVFPIEVPPLRERRADIPQLVMFFLSRFSRNLGKRISAVAPETLQHLTAYEWPGNVRELQNVIERAVVLCEGPVLEIDRDLVPLPLATAHASEPARPSASTEAALANELAGQVAPAVPPVELAPLEEIERRPRCAGARFLPRGRAQPAARRERPVRPAHWPAQPLCSRRASRVHWRERSQAARGPDLDRFPGPVPRTARRHARSRSAAHGHFPATRRQ